MNPLDTRAHPPPEPSPPAVRRLPYLKLALLALFCVKLFIAERLGVFRIFADPARAKAVLLSLGPGGYAVFVVAYALLQPFGVPGTLFVLVAPMIWPWPLAFALSMLGTMAASVVGFSLARYVARDWVLARIPPRFRRYDEALARRGLLTVITLRFVFWMPPLLHAFFGVSGVPFWTHFWGSAIGYVVPLLVVAYFGERFFSALRSAPAWTWLVLASVLLLGLGLFWQIKRRSSPGRID